MPMLRDYFKARKAQKSRLLKRKTFPGEINNEGR